MSKKIFLTIFYLGLFALVLNINLDILSLGTHAHAADWITQNLIQKGSSEPWVFSLWNFCINLINIILIGILIFLGVVNILHINYDTYQIKKFLLPLIISVILANFSLFICRAIMELAGALSMTFFNQTQYEQIYRDIMAGLNLNFTDVSQWIAATWGLDVNSIANIGTLIINTLIGTILSVILVVVFLLLAAVLYVRVYVIYILAAISPLAYIFMVLPNTQGLFRQWWSWFLKFVFMGPVIALIIKVAAVIGKAGTVSTLGSIAVMLAIIALMVVAIMTPWLLGMNKITTPIVNGAKQAAGAGWKAIGTTRLGRNVQGMLQAYPEKVKEGAAIDVTSAKNATKRMMDVAGAKGSMGDISRAGREEMEMYRAEDDLKRLKFSDKESYMRNLKSPMMKNLSGESMRLYAQQGADKGWFDKDNIGDLYAAFSSNKNTKNNADDYFEKAMKTNNEERIAKHRGPLDTTGIVTKGNFTEAQKISLAANDLSNHDNLIDQADNDGNLRNKIRQNAIKQASMVYDAYSTETDANKKARLKPAYEQALKTFNQSISVAVETNTDGSGTLKNDANYIKLMTAMNPNIGKVKAFIEEDPTIKDAIGSGQGSEAAMQFISKKYDLSNMSHQARMQHLEQMLIGRDSISKINPDRKAEFFRDNNEANEIARHNEAQLEKYDKYAKEITDNLATRKIITQEKYISDNKLST